MNRDMKTKTLTKSRRTTTESNELVDYWELYDQDTELN